MDWAPTEIQRKLVSEGGFGILESLASTVLVSILAVAVIMNLVVALRTTKITEVNHAASSLAVSKMEELASVDTILLDSSFNETEGSLVWADFNFTFTRNTVVTVNPDDTRTVDITVSSNSSNVPSSVEFSTTFAVWE